MPIIGISSNVILVIIGVGLLIFVHELGHFLVAKKVGVRVYAFSLGFGPAIIRKHWRSGCSRRMRATPRPNTGLDSCLPKEPEP